MSSEEQSDDTVPQDTAPQNQPETPPKPQDTVVPKPNPSPPPSPENRNITADMDMNDANDRNVIVEQTDKQNTESEKP